MFGLTPWKREQTAESGGVAGLSGGQLSPFRGDFDDLLNRAWQGWPSLLENFPSDGWGTDIDESESEYTVRIEAPGFEAGDFDVQVRNGQLVIRAEHKEERKGNGGEKSGYRYGSFYRSLPLPYGAEPEQIEAKYRNGLLELRMPKSEQARGRRVAITQG
jgi:HSP20 family protein